MSYRKYSVDTSVFSSLDSKAEYWLGFLYADGSVTKTNVLTVMLKSSDADHLLKLKEFLRTDTPIKNSIRLVKGKEYGAAGLTVRSKDLCASLATYGIVPRKTYVGCIPDSVCSSRNFWRGMVDGDGYVGVDTKGRFRLELTFHNKDTGTKFLEFLKENAVDTKASILPNKNSYRVVLLSTPARVAYKLLYENIDVALTRKAAFYERLEL